MAPELAVQEQTGRVAYTQVYHTSAISLGGELGLGLGSSGCGQRFYRQCACQGAVRTGGECGFLTEGSQS